jgi:hypothetical protein
MTSNIRTVSSPSHPITFEFGDEPTQGVVTMQPSPAGTPPVDFVLLTKLATPHQYSPSHHLFCRVSRVASGVRVQCAVCAVCAMCG